MSRTDGIAAHLLQYLYLADGFYPEAADMNNDGDITITDAAIILSRILNE